jgi:hypothetical protein
MNICVTRKNVQARVSPLEGCFTVVQFRQYAKQSNEEGCVFTAGLDVQAIVSHCEFDVLADYCNGLSHHNWNTSLRMGIHRKA